MFNQLVSNRWILIVNQFMRVLTLFLDQWNNNCKQSKEIVRSVDIGVLEENYSSEWASSLPSIAIPKKNRTIRVVTDFRKLKLLLKCRTSPISYSKDWVIRHDLFNRRVYLCFSIGLKYGILSHQT
jgi:hypothetical protein